MRIGWLVVWALCGCGSLQPNPGRFLAIAAAAHAGQFERSSGRWPANRLELERFPCPNLDSALSPEGPRGANAACAFLADLPYVIEMRPRGRGLAMVFRDGAAHRICTLRVLAPRHPAGTAIAPLSIIRTGFFSCPGEPEEHR